MDLFFDFIDDLQQELKNKRKEVENYLHKQGYVFSLDVLLEDFIKSFVNESLLDSTIDKETLTFIFYEVFFHFIFDFVEKR